MLNEDPITIVTGGASGIGLATVTLLARRGHRVVALDVAAPPAVDDRVEVVQADVGDPVAVETAVAHARALGPIRGLVNAAGIRGGAETVEAIARESARLELDPGARRSTSIAPLELVTVEAFQRMLRVHLTGTFLTMKFCLPDMLAARTGAIVNVSSICGIEGCATNPHYAAAKAAIIGLTKSVARDAARSGVRINALAPGYVRTPMMGTMDPVRESALLDEIPLGRFATPEEIADSIAYLLGDQASFICGQVLSPNGGHVV
jgi:3-oxoacyl-[acyl-carrier protein] reductase